MALPLITDLMAGWRITILSNTPGRRRYRYGAQSGSCGLDDRTICCPCIYESLDWILEDHEH